MRFKKQIITGILLLLSFTLSAFSLGEALDEALANNHNLQVEKAEIEVYNQKYYAARGLLLPQLSLQGEYRLSNTRIPDSSLGDYVSVSSLLQEQPEDMSASDAVLWENQQIIAGYLDSALGDIMPSQEIEEGSLAGGISLTQTVFAGGKLLSGINIADRVRNMQKDKYRLAVQEVIFETIRLYYGVKLAEEVAAIQQEALATANSHLEDVNRMFEQGLVSEYDYLRAELECKRLEPEVLQAQNNLKLARKNLCNFTGREDLTDEKLETELQEIEVETPVFELALEEGLQNRIEVQLAELNIRTSEVLFKMEKADYYPRIGLTAGYNFYTAADDYEIDSADFGTQAYIGLGFQLPLFTGLRQISEVREKQMQIRQAEEKNADTRELISLDIQNACQQVEYSKESLRVQSDNVTLAEKGYKIAKARYSSGQGTELEISDAQLMLKQAKLSYRKALYDLILASAQYDKAVGRDLEKKYKGAGK